MMIRTALECMPWCHCLLSTLLCWERVGLRVRQAVLHVRGWHEDLIACNISKALVCWLEPCCDKSTGKVTMPHVKIREAVLRWVDMLPLDTSRETHKSQIVETNIGTRHLNQAFF